MEQIGNKVCHCAFCQGARGDYPSQIVRQEREYRTQPENNGKTRIGCLFMLIKLPVIAFYYFFRTPEQRGLVSDERREK